MGSQTVYFWPQLPKWVKEEHYDIQARAEGNPTKDELRAMMRALLADRFQMVVHRETREMPVFDLMVAAPGKFGLRLHAHPADGPCPAPPNVTDEFPVACGGIYGQKASASNHLRLGGRNIPMQLVADFRLYDRSGPGYAKSARTWRSGCCGPLGTFLSTGIEAATGTRVEAAQGSIRGSAARPHRASVGELSYLLR